MVSFLADYECATCHRRGRDAIDEYEHREREIEIAGNRPEAREAGMKMAAPGVKPGECGSKGISSAPERGRKNHLHLCHRAGHNRQSA